MRKLNYIVGVTSIVFTHVIIMPARSDEIPGVGLLVDYHYSIDEKFVKIVFNHEKAKKGSFPNLIIPRAYIHFVNGAPKGAPIPDYIESSYVGLVIANETGEAWTTAVNAKAKRDGTKSDAAAQNFPGGFNIVYLSPNTNPKAAEDLVEGARYRAIPQEPFEGLEHVRYLTGTGSSFIGTSDDEFFLAHCYNPVNMKFLCTYNMKMNTNISATVTFGDFRIRGGRHYANQRLRSVRKVVCQYLEACVRKP